MKISVTSLAGLIGMHVAERMLQVVSAEPHFGNQPAMSGVSKLMCMEFGWPRRLPELADMIGTAWPWRGDLTPIHIPESQL